MKILVVGQFKERLYQDLILSLDAGGGDIYCKNYDRNTSNSKLSSLESKPINGVDILLECLPPFLMEYDSRGGLNVGVCDLPTYPPPLNWTNKANSLDFHLTTNNIKVGTKPSQIISVGVDTNKYNLTYSTIKELEEFKNNRFLFYSICPFSGKSEFANVFRAIFTEFKHWEQVGLVLKVNSSHFNEKELIAHLYEGIKLVQHGINKERTIPVMILTEDKYSNEQIHTSCDCYIDMDRGFNYHFNTIDAIGFGNPIIYHNSTHQEYYGNHYPVQSYNQSIYEPNHELYMEQYDGTKSWMEYDTNHLMRTFRKALNDIKITRWLSERFSYENVGKKILKVLNHELQKKDN